MVLGNVLYMEYMDGTAPCVAPWIDSENEGRRGGGRGKEGRIPSGLQGQPGALYLEERRCRAVRLWSVLRFCGRRCGNV